MLRRAVGAAARRFSAGRGNVSHAGGDAELFVKNLGRISADEVRDLFETVCNVSHVRVPVGVSRSENRGCAFVRVSLDDADRVCRELNNSLMPGGFCPVGNPRAARRIIVQLSNESPRGAANGMIVAANKDLSKELLRAKTAADILRLFEKHEANYNAANLASSLHRLGVLGRWSFDPSSEELFCKLIKRAAQSVSETPWEARLMNNAVWGAVKVGGDASSLFEAVSKKAPEQIWAFKPAELSLLVWAFAKAGFAAPALFDAVAGAALQKMEFANPSSNFKAQDFANMAWAFSKAGVEDRLLFKMMACEASKILRFFKPQELASLAWAYSSTGFEAPSLMRSISHETAYKMALLSPAELAETVYTQAKAELETPMLFEAVAAEVLQKITAFAVQDLSKTVFAFATAGAAEAHRPLFDAVVEEALRRMHTFTAEHLSNLAWAYATAADHRSDRFLFHALGAEAKTKVKTFPAAALATTAWAFAQAGHEAGELFDVLEVEVLDKLSGFNAHDLANTAWAFATVRVEAPLLFEAVALEATKKVKAFETHELATLACAFSAAGVAAPSLFEAIAIEAGNKACTSDDSKRLEWAFTTAGAPPALSEALAGRGVLLTVDKAA